MRPFPTIPLDFIGNDSIKTRTRSSPRINPDEISRIKSDAVEGIDLSSGSIDEFKRIEALLTSDPNSILKEFGVTLGRLEKTRDVSDFNTASFNSKEELKFLNLGKSNAKLPARDVLKSEYVPYDEFSANILQGFGDLSTQDFYISKSNSQKIQPPKPATFKERLERMQAEKKAAAATASVLSRSETEGDRMDTESTFGIKRVPRAEVEISQQIKLFNKVPRVSESPPMRPMEGKLMRQPRFAGELDAFYDEEESSIYAIENDLRTKSSFMKSWDEKQKPASQSFMPEENCDIDSYLKHLMVPRKMKISIGGIPFQDVIFVLSLRFFDKSSNFENFVFEWSDVKAGEMIGYIRCDYITHVHKQSSRRFNIACKEPTEGKPDVLHHVHVETESPVLCDLYVNGLNAVVKYMQKTAANSKNKGI